jgi:hypothetical protein
MYIHILMHGQLHSYIKMHIFIFIYTYIEYIFNTYLSPKQISVNLTREANNTGDLISVCTTSSVRDRDNNRMKYIRGREEVGKLWISFSKLTTACFAHSESKRRPYCT